MRLENTEGSSRKFWEATVAGNVLHVRWGRLGTEGQRKSHVFGDEAEALAARDQLAREKLRKGYLRVGDEALPEATPSAKPTAGTPPRLPPAEARARTATLAPAKRSDGGVLTWSLFRGPEGAREFLEISVAGRELEIARGKVGKQGRVREITLDPGESVAARVIRELAKALSDGFAASGEEAPTPDIPAPEDTSRRRAAAWLRRHAREGYVPLVEAGEGPLGGSRFGGTPALMRDEPAPVCGVCQKPLTLIVQLAHASLPPKAQQALPSGLIQLLWCDTICQSEGGWKAFSPANLARAIPSSKSLRPPAPDELPERVFEPKRITGWSTVETYPSYSERPATDGHRDDDLADAVDELCDDESAGFRNRGGERLLGWAHWIQDVEVVTCRSCRKRMAPVLQVDTNTTLAGLAFGDSGIGFLMSCPACQAMTFVWQSC